MCNLRRRQSIDPHRNGPEARFNGHRPEPVPATRVLREAAITPTNRNQVRRGPATNEPTPGGAVVAEEPEEEEEAAAETVGLPGPHRPITLVTRLHQPAAANRDDRVAVVPVMKNPCSEKHLRHWTLMQQIKVNIAKLNQQGD
jgi:hypothetical protein